MSTNEPALPDKPLIEIYPDASDQQPSHPSFVPVDPDNPPWSVPRALLVWVISVALLFFLPLFGAIPYVIYKVTQGGSIAGLEADANLIFISILGVLPAHILTFLTVWLLVTNRGRRPFWQSLGWSWPRNFGPWKAIGLSVLLLIVGIMMTRYLPGTETQLDQIINSSLKARFTAAFLAAVSAPLVEELLYRGVLYSAFQKVLGMPWAVVLVSVLFAGVHVVQYYNNIGVITAVAMLSVALTLVRARTGSVLPSYVMHLVFNGIQAIFIVVQPFVEKSTIENEAPIGFLIHSLSQLLT